MADTISIDIEQLNKQVSNLNEALAAFESRVGCIPQNKDLLGGNSDFLDAFLKLIGNISDDVNPELLATIKEHIQSIDGIATAFEQADEGVTQMWQEGS
jgi:uncharacterized protein YukE